MRENITDLPDVAKYKWMGGGSARQSLVVFSFICARIYKHVVLLPISTDSLLIIWSILLIINRLDVTCVSCNILTAILSVIRKSDYENDTQP